MQLYDRGIRRRLAPMLRNDRRRLELAYSLMLTLPGTPVIRYGDEIGMGDDLSLPERECARTPMQWSSEPLAGFTDARRAVGKVIGEGPFGFAHVNVAEQRRDPSSLLNWMERVIRMRKEILEVSWGDFEVLPLDDNAILMMRYTWRGNSVLFLHNLSDAPCEAAFHLPQRLINVLSDDHSEADGQGRHRILLESYGYRWFREGGLDYILKRKEVDLPL
jgi:maltose alpha-D-glucosyltransferase/alpha-amylase